LAVKRLLKVRSFFHGNATHPVGESLWMTNEP
jgi:hypothetical protein